MAFLKWPDKDPDEVLDYNIDWSKRLVTGDTISTSTWFVPDGLTNEEEDKTTTETTVWLSGGTLAQNYSVLNRVVTVEGRTMDQTVTLKIKTK
jgi:hypothetical protein